MQPRVDAGHTVTSGVSVDVRAQNAGCRSHVYSCAEASELASRLDRQRITGCRICVGRSVSVGRCPRQLDAVCQRAFNINLHNAQHQPDTSPDWLAAVLALNYRRFAHSMDVSLPGRIAPCRDVSATNKRRKRRRRQMDGEDERQRRWENGWKRQTDEEDGRTPDGEDNAVFSVLSSSPPQFFSRQRQGAKRTGGETSLGHETSWGRNVKGAKRCDTLLHKLTSYLPLLLTAVRILVC